MEPECGMFLVRGSVTKNAIHMTPVVLNSLTEAYLPPMPGRGTFRSVYSRRPCGPRGSGTAGPLPQYVPASAAPGPSPGTTPSAKAAGLGSERASGPGETRPTSSCFCY